MVDGEAALEDGRHARRDRNKYAVVDAYLELVRAGNSRPSVAEVAAQSGVSHRSVFRYFADKDELARTAIERQYDFVGPLSALSVEPHAPLDQRLDRFVTRRLALYDRLAPVARLSRTLMHSQPVIAAELTVTRGLLREQIVHLFGAELAQLSKAERTSALAAMDVVCSFEAVDLMRHDQGLSGARTKTALVRALGRLIGPAS
jgi:AcrR family transcriptional regulator